MNRNVIRIAAIAALGLVAAQGAIAAPLQGAGNTAVTAPPSAFMTDDRDAGGGAYVAGSGENQSVAYAGAPPRGVAAAPARIVGTGGNQSVELAAPTFGPSDGWVAIVEGSGENQSVRYVRSPRG
jgi:hypothetical protein